MTRRVQMGKLGGSEESPHDTPEEKIKRVDFESTLSMGQCTHSHRLDPKLGYRRTEVRSGDWRGDRSDANLGSLSKVPTRGVPPFLFRAQRETCLRLSTSVATPSCV